jgi:hypothetical protein
MAFATIPKEMSKRFLNLTAIVASVHLLATMIFCFLAIRTLLDDVFGHLTYSERVYNFLADLFVQPSTAILNWFGIDLGSSPWGLVYLVLNSLIWGAAIATLISVTARQSRHATPRDSLELG